MFTQNGIVNLQIIYIMKSILRFFDKLEDKIRGRLSRHPIAYAMIGAAGSILIWKGIWETAEYYPILDGPGSILLGTVLLLVTGLFVSVFIGNDIIISGLRGEKKLTDKTETEVRAEYGKMEQVLFELKEIKTDIKMLKEEKREIN